MRTWAGRLTGIAGQLCEGTWVPGEEKRSRFWWWMLVLPEAGLLLAELVPRCGRWGAVWDRELLLPKGTFRGLGSPDGSVQGKELWDLGSSGSALGRLHQVGCLLTGSLCRQEELTMRWLLRLSLLFSTLPCGCFSPSCCGERSSGQRSSLQNTLPTETCAGWLLMNRSEDVDSGGVTTDMSHSLPSPSAAVVWLGSFLPHLFLMISPPCFLSPVFFSICSSTYVPFYASFHSSILFLQTILLCCTIPMQPSTQPAFHSIFHLAIIPPSHLMVVACLLCTGHSAWLWRHTNSKEPTRPLL